MDHLHSYIEGLNVTANLLTVAGVGVAIFILVTLIRMGRRLESVIAPKAGIENYLNMCAQVVEADPDGTCVVNDSGEIVLVNSRMEHLTGYHRSELVGNAVEMLVPDDLRGMHAHHREMFVSSPSMRPMRGLKLRHKHGRELDVAIRLNRYLDASGGYTIAKVRVPE